MTIFQTMARGVRFLCYLGILAIIASPAICQAQILREQAEDAGFEPGAGSATQSNRPQSGDMDYVNIGDVDVSPQERTFVPESLILRPDHLFGDWFGTRTQMEDDGITPTVTWVSNIAGNPTGGMKSGFTEAENLGFDCVFNLEKLRGIENTNFHVSLSQRSGASLSEDYIGNTFPVQQVFGGETFKVVDVDVMHVFADGAMDVRMGRIAVGDEFLISEYFWAFMNNAFDGNPKSVFFNAPGASAYPSASWGARFRVRPTERTYAMIGVYDGDTDVWDNSRHGLDWSMHGPAFVIGEVGYHPNGLPKDTGKIGNYKIGGYYNGGTFNKWNGQYLGTSGYYLPNAQTQGDWGYYAIFDQVIFNPEGRKSTRGLGVFGCVVVAPDDTINQMPFFCDGGMVVRGLFPSRPTDSLSFGMAYGKFSSDMADAQTAAHAIDPSVGVQDYELVYEWSYRFRIRNGAMFFQPDLQYIVNPGGAYQYANAFVVGAQIGLNF
jgi:porin